MAVSHVQSSNNTQSVQQMQAAQQAQQCSSPSITIITTRPRPMPPRPFGQSPCGKNVNTVA